MTHSPEGELPILPTAVRGANGAHILIIDASSVAEAAVNAELMISAEQMIARVVNFTDHQYLVVVKRRAARAGDVRAVG